MPVLPAQTIPIGFHIVVPVVDFAPNGDVDTVEPLTVFSNQPATATVAIDPANPRQVKITAVAPGTSGVTIGAPGVSSANVLTVPVTVPALPDQSRIELGAGGVLGPFAN